MKKAILFLSMIVVHTSIYATIISCSKDVTTDTSSNETVENNNKPEEVEPDTISTKNFVLQSTMQATQDLVGKDHNAINQYMHTLGWDYTENPNSSELDDKDGIHCVVEYDNDLKQYVYKFSIHANSVVLDGDRGKIVDRQRNEMKSQTSSQWYKMNGNWDEWQRVSWKFRIPKGFQPSSSFCHIHQLKAQEGNNGAPLITITPRSNSDGSNCRVQVIHTGDVSASTKGTIIDNLPLSDFEDQWIQVETEMHYTHHGFFKIKLTRISDGKVIVDKSFNDIDLWRKGATNIRNKFGIYRSYGSSMTDKNDRPTNGIKDETLKLGDFKVYEADTNPNPQPHD